MRLYLRTLIGISLTVLALVLLLSTWWQHVLRTSYASFEERDTISNLHRAENLVRDRIASINGHLNDWAAWDVTWEWMETRDPAYLTDNFAGPVTLQDLGLHFVAYVTPSGEIIHKSAIDPAAKDPVYAPFPAGLLTYLAPGSKLVGLTTPDSRLSGILNIPEGTLLLAAQPIVKGSHEGPVRGTLVWGRFLTTADIEKIGELSHLSVVMARPGDLKAAPDLTRMSAELVGSADRPLVRILDEDRVAGYAVMHDIFDQPALVVRIDTPRSIFLQGEEIVLQSMGWLSLAGLVFGAVVMFLMRRIVLTRVARMSRELQGIGSRGDLSGRVSTSGDDELGLLAESVNGMLSQIEVAQSELGERETLRRSEERYRGLVETSPSAVVIECDGKIVFANVAAGSLLGALDARALLERHLADLYVEAAPDMPVLREGLEPDSASERYLRRLDGRVLVVEQVERSIRYQDQVARQIMFHNITERKQAEQQLYFLAYHDAMTSLPNRVMFARFLEKEIAYARRAGEQVVVMIMDLDQFKRVNDTVGHAGGDAVLHQVAEGLKTRIRSSDILARSGGDEFLLICPHVRDNQTIHQLAKRILSLFEAPLRFGAHEFFLTPSIGISLYPLDGDGVETLTKHADIAMYRAKANGGRGYQFYDAEMGVALSRRQTMETHLRKALMNNELTLHFQPQLDLFSGRIIAAEALMRWKHPDLGWISPAQFIPIAEETGLIIPMTEWVLTTAVDQLLHWDKLGVPTRVAVNLSAKHFHFLHQQDLIQSIERLIEARKFDPGLLELEITESAAMTNMENATAVLCRLHDLGVALAIDDFGTGYSSMAYLKRFPINALKIDRAFVKDVDTSPDGRAIVEAIIAMSHALRLTVVAEGVETLEQLEFLRSQSCDSIQGFLFCKPVPAEELTALLVQGATADSLLEARGVNRDEPRAGLKVVAR